MPATRYIGQFCKDLEGESGRVPRCDRLPPLVIRLVLVAEAIGDAADDDALRWVIHMNAEQETMSLHFHGEGVSVVLADKLVDLRAVRREHFLAGGDRQAVRDLLALYRDLLKRMVHLRLSRRLQGRVDDSDVLQEAFLDITGRLAEYAADPKLPLFLWMRHMTGLKLSEIHRRHLGTQLRDADREVTLHRGGLPEADSVSLAAQLLGHLTTPSQAAIKAEMRQHLAHLVSRQFSRWRVGPLFQLVQGFVRPRLLQLVEHGNVFLNCVQIEP